VGGILHPRLNTDGRPIAHKYRKGKMQRTLKREFKELEAVEREAIADYGVNDQIRASFNESGVSGLSQRLAFFHLQNKTRGNPTLKFGPVKGSLREGNGWEKQGQH